MPPVLGAFLAAEALRACLYRRIRGPQGGAIGGTDLRAAAGQAVKTVEQNRENSGKKNARTAEPDRQDGGMKRGTGGNGEATVGTIVLRRDFGLSTDEKHMAERGDDLIGHFCLCINSFLLADPTGGCRFLVTAGKVIAHFALNRTRGKGPLTAAGNSPPRDT